MVEDPTTSPLVPSDMTVPAIVIGGAFGVRVVPAIFTPFDRTVTDWPAAVMTGTGVRPGRGTVDVPTTRPLFPREIEVPEIVIAGAFGVRVIPAIATPFGRMVAGCPAAVITGAVVGAGRGIVDVPTTRPLFPREIGVPEIVMAGAFGVRVVPAIATPFGRIVAGCPAAVMTGAGVRAGRGTIDVPTTRPLFPREIGVSEIVMAGAFGVRVVPAIATPFGRMVAGCPAAVITGAGAGAGRGTVDEPTTSPLAPRAMGVPATVIAGAFAVKVVPAMPTPFERMVAG